MTRWTIWQDYYATGEGRMIMALIVYAETAEKARQLYAEKFHDYFAQGATVEEGVVRNEVTEYLFSSDALELAIVDPSVYEMHASFCFNRS